MPNEKIIKGLISSFFIFIYISTTLLVLGHIPLYIFTPACLVTVLILSIYLIHKGHYSLTIFITITIYVTAIAIVYFHPAGQVGIDPNRFDLWISELIAFGHTADVSAEFYASAGLYITLISTYSIVAEITPRGGMAIMALGTGVLVPLLVTIFTKRCTSSTKYATIGCVIFIFMVGTFRRGYWPTAQVHSLLLWSVAIVFLSNLVSSSSGSSRWVIIYTILLIALSLVHKLALAILVGFFLYYYMVSYLPNGLLNMGEGNVSRVLILGVVLFFIQQAIISVHIESAVYRVLPIFENFSRNLDIFIQYLNLESAYEPEPKPEGAGPSPSSIFSRYDFYFLLGVCGISWISIYIPNRSRGDANTNILLLSSSFLVILTFMALYTPETLVSRIRYMSEFIFASLISVALFHLQFRKEYALIALVLILLPFLALNPAMSPDHPDQPRYYLNSEEIQSVEYISNHMTGELHTDNFAFEAAQKYDRETQYISSSNRFLAKNIGSTHQVWYRTIEIHHVEHRWTIEWELKNHLDSEKNRIYDSGDNKVFTPSL